MMLLPFRLVRIAVLLTALSFCSCEQLFDQGRSKNFETAKKKAADGDFHGAIAYYEASLDTSPESAETHYLMGLIYADKLRSPMDALHHFERYLRLAPRGKYVKEARAYRKEGEQKLLSTLTKGSPNNQQEAVRLLKNDNLSLRNALVELRAKKNAMPPPKSPEGRKKGEQVQRPVPPGSRTHVVKSGETLAVLAVKYYKSKNRWKDIQDANFYALEGTATIKPGMVLIIP
jgi:tetratricopeptide (TPR) repeat protein